MPAAKPVVAANSVQAAAIYASAPQRYLGRLLIAAPAIFAAYLPSVSNAAPEQEQSARPTETRPPVRPAAAPNTAPATGEKIQQVEIKGSVQSYDERRNDTATKIVITQEEILKNGDSTISEVLKRLPGITLGGVQGRGGEIRMRGLGAGYTQIMLNGEPAPPGFSLDSIAPDLIERIEILRAATAEFSTQAVAGGINVVLKRAITTSQREIKIGGQEDNGRIGGEVNLQMSDRKGPISYTLAGGLGHGKFERKPTLVTETFSDPSGLQTQLRETTQTSTGTFDRINFAPRVNLTLAPGETLTSQSFVNAVRFKGINTDRTNTILGPTPPYPGNDYTLDNSFAIVRSDLNWARKLAAGAKIDAKFGVNWNRRETNLAQSLLDSKGNKILQRDIDSSGSDRGFSGSGKYSTPYAQDHALAIGWDGGLSNRGEDRSQRDANPAGLSTFRSDETYAAAVKRAALFAQDEWNVTPRWSVYLGLRWEGLDTTSSGSTYAEIRNRSSVWSPIFQTLYKLPDSKNDQIRLAITRTYKAPQTQSLIPRRFTSNNNSVTSPDTQGNPALKPELAWGLDLAYEHFLPGGGLLSASTFMRRIQDITRRSLMFTDGLWVSMPINDGVATTRGIELEAKMPLRSVWKEAPSIEIRANLSRNWSTISTVPGPNNRLDQQTPLSANAGADWKLDGLPLTLGGNFNFQAGGPVRISAAQSIYTRDKRVLDAYALWKFTPTSQLRVSIANGLHQDNVSETAYVDASGTARSSTLVPTTMQIRALAEVKF